MANTIDVTWNADGVIDTNRKDLADAAYVVGFDPPRYPMPATIMTDTCDLDLFRMMQAGWSRRDYVNFHIYNAKLDGAQDGELFVG